MFAVPISHGEGRFVADEATLRRLAENGQIATQYVDPDGNVATDMPLIQRLRMGGGRHYFPGRPRAGQDGSLRTQGRKSIQECTL